MTFLRSIKIDKRIMRTVLKNEINSYIGDLKLFEIKTLQYYFVPLAIQFTFEVYFLNVSSVEETNLPLES